MGYELSRHFKVLEGEVENVDAQRFAERDTRWDVAERSIRDEVRFGGTENERVEKKMLLHYPDDRKNSDYQYRTDNMPAQHFDMLKERHIGIASITSAKEFHAAKFKV